MQPPFTRGAGILLPVSSLPSPYGIGTLGEEARRFIDQLARAGQSYWQMLPVGPVSYGDSPYQSFSAFAGNPYYIDLDELIGEGLLTAAEVEAVPWGDDPARVDYALLYAGRLPLLRMACARSPHDGRREYRRFCRDNAGWLDDYALFMALKTHFDGREWLAWDEDIRLHRPEAVARYTADLAEEIAFWRFVQYRFYRQWDALKAYAGGRGIRLIGDIPIYVALDSADVWANRALFELDVSGHPRHVAGVPPDLFSATGQRWGNPLYDWTAMEADGFRWWEARLRACARLYDVIRIDHFIGIARYYAIPASCDTAMEGAWRPGPGKRLTSVISRAAGEARILAEDLGVLHRSVKALLRQTGYPGMKVLLFAFGGGADNPHLPHNYDRNTFVYGGTHDNETIAGYCRARTKRELRPLLRYLHIRRKKQVPRAMLRAAYGSVAAVAIFQMQDILELGNEARMNTPSTLGGNWQWRLLPGQFTPQHGKRLRKLVRLYGRDRVPPTDKG